MNSNDCMLEQMKFVGNISLREKEKGICVLSLGCYNALLLRCLEKTGYKKLLGILYHRIFNFKITSKALISTKGWGMGSIEK